MAETKEVLEDLKERISNIRVVLQRKFDNPNETVEIEHIKLNGAVYNFEIVKSGPKKTTNEHRIELLKHISMNLRTFLTKFMQPKLTSVQQNNPHVFVESITLLWSHYQRLIYCYDFIINKMKNFCLSFYKIKDNYKTQTGNDTIGMVAVMGAAELQNFIQNYQPLVKAFSQVFCDFISEERKSKAVPREHIKESLAFFQCSFLNHESYIDREDDRIFLTKRYNKELPANLRSTDHSFFQEKFLPKLLESIHFYDDFVRRKAPNLTAADEIAEMKRLIEEEERRALQYIHAQKNREEYLKKVDEVLVIQDIKNRIEKPNGLKKYLASYNPGEGQMEFKDELTTFWDVYKRVLRHSLDPVKKLYEDYLHDEGVAVKGKIEKWKDFIEDLIRINRKNNDILEIFDRNFDLKNMLKNNLTRMLSNNLIEDKTGKAVNFRGAKNLALFIDAKFKMLYRKPNELQLQSDTLADIVAIFKILTEKDTFLKEHEKTTATRLIEEVDFGKDQEVFAITSLEDKFINQIRNELGFSEVKYLTENMKDMNKSYEETKRIKAQVQRKCHEFNQVVIKSSSFWPETVSYEIQNPPNVLLPMRDSIREAIGRKGEVKFQFTNGVSMFKGSFPGPGDQIFQLRNIYLVILLFIDQEKGKTIKFGDLKIKMKNTASQGRRKTKAINELERNIIELLHSGLIRSPNKDLKEGEADVAKVVESDEFVLNLKFNFEEEQKRQKRPAKMIKKLKVINNIQVTILPGWLEKALKQELNQQKLEEEEYEMLKKNKVKGEVRKMLKHAHNQNKYCEFEDFTKSCGKMKEYPVTHRLMKEMIENLINEGVCERVEDQKNTYRYIA